MAKLSDLTEKFETFWPGSHADAWDRVGLLVGSSKADVSKILVAVDLTETVIQEAIDLEAELILTHHPFLLKGVESVSEDRLKGLLIAKLIRSGISVYSAHTNADVQEDGASTLMARAFGLNNLNPLVPTSGGFGHGVIGTLAAETTLANFSKTVSAALPPTARKVAFSGNPSRIVKTVAICSGAGDSFLPVVLESEADVYVTSDLRHHPTQDAVLAPREHGPLSLIDVSHWAAESLWVAHAVNRLNTLTGVTAFESSINTDPWTREVD